MSLATAFLPGLFSIFFGIKLDIFFFFNFVQKECFLLFTVTFTWPSARFHFFFQEPIKILCKQFFSFLLPMPNLVYLNYCISDIHGMVQFWCGPYASDLSLFLSQCSHNLWLLVSAQARHRANTSFPLILAGSTEYKQFPGGNTLQEISPKQFRMSSKCIILISG